ncbi:hypothetical protein K501DRAFT_265399 [Backusella circina FSU 941]|nr:hypothetical protein K501DRAFT_265399 [Backusella circina FSU 941]
MYLFSIYVKVFYPSSSSFLFYFGFDSDSDSDSDGDSEEDEDESGRGFLVHNSKSLCSILKPRCSYYLPKKKGLVIYRALILYDQSNMKKVMKRIIHQGLDKTEKTLVFWDFVLTVRIINNELEFRLLLL